MYIEEKERTEEEQRREAEQLAEQLTINLNDDEEDKIKEKK